MNWTELVARARTQVNTGIKYQLGAGPRSRRDVCAGGSDKYCDCSAFVCWCLGMDKLNEQWGWLTALNGGWYNTSGMWYDAMVFERFGSFYELDQPAPGAVVVYPSRTLTGDSVSKRYGHCGIVTECEIIKGPDGRVGSKASKVIHCSSGNYQRTGDAVQETNLEVFDRQKPYTAFAWCSGIEHEHRRIPVPEWILTDADIA